MIHRRSAKMLNGRRAFTLIELMIAIVIFSIIILFLYQTTDTLRSANAFYGEKVAQFSQREKLLKTLYLDLALSQPTKGQVISIDKDYDVVLMQTSHSVHRRTLPYVGYFPKEGKLYRIESLEQLKNPLTHDMDFVVDEVANVEQFRLYLSQTHFLLHMRMAGKDTVLKIRILNQ